MIKPTNSITISKPKSQFIIVLLEVVYFSMTEDDEDDAVLLFPSVVAGAGLVVPAFDA